MSPLRILAVQTGFNLTAGGARVDFEILAALAKQGHDVRILMPAVNRADPVPPGCEVQYIPARGLGFPQSLGLLSLPSLLLQGRTYRPDIIRDHSPYTFGFASLAAQKILRVPIVASFLHPEHDKALVWTEQHLLAQYDHVTTISQYSLGGLLSRSGIDPTKTSYAYCGIGSEFEPRANSVSEWKNQHSFALDEPVFSTAGALIPRKNHSFLLDVMERWVGTGKRGVLLIYGNGPEKMHLSGEIKRRQLQQTIRLCDAIPTDTLIDVLNASTAFLFPSFVEGFGLAAAEALACGVPALVSDRASLPEVVRHGETGFVLPIDRGPEPWVAAMARLVSNPALRRQMGEAAVADVHARFNWDNNAREMASVFEHVVASHRDIKSTA